MKSVELEKALLGCVIQDPSQIDKVLSWIDSDDFFYSEFNKKVWIAIRKLHKENKQIDLNTISDKVNLNNTGYHVVYEISGFLEKVTSPSHAVAYAKMLHNYYLRRMLDRQMSAISQDINDNSVETQALLEDAHTTIGNIIKLQPNKIFSVNALLEETKESIFNSTTLIQTGLPKLDRVITGMTRGEITIIAGRPGNAKTTVAANMARNLVHQGKKVIMFNREMPNTEMMKKFLAMESDSLQYRNLRNNISLDQDSIQETMDKIKEVYEGRLFMFDDVRDMENTFREIKAIKPDVVIDDHI